MKAAEDSLLKNDVEPESCWSMRYMNPARALAA
jgi:hypothetical protein